MASGNFTDNCVCAICGDTFFSRAYRIKTGRGKFCSYSCANRDRTRPAIVRFWEKVQKSDGCWLWTGDKNELGYGTLMVPPQKRIRAHRLSWEIHNGAVPNGLFVLHNCPGGDNPSCCNPAHLFLGTNADNVADCVAKGRQARGETQSGKLTADDVREIRRRCHTGESQRILAKEFGVRQSAISRIFSRKNWKHVQ